MKKIAYYRSVKLATCLLFIFGQVARAQDLDSTKVKVIPADSVAAVKPDSIPRPDPVLIDTIRYRLIGDGNFTRGNVNRSLMVLRAELLFSGPLISISTNPRFTYGKQNGVLAERDSYADLFFDVFKKSRTYVFGLGVLETSNLRRIDLRQMAGAGVGFRVLRGAANNLSLTNAILYESTNFAEIATVTTVRNSFRIKGKHSVLQDKIRFNHITFIQPALNDLSNLRWNTILSIELPINKWVTLRTSFENSYESVVEATRKKNDSRITFGVSVGNK
ncbi:DUF481 domain-containing protein [Dyadobacter bucti]|uniref:DUF481 domain-containing protein n=1 Tax=Dyadobacter bucti TaxID=2572203 RepID=UPI001108008B|nr:DUF481 domain-containing protein [Dyadobacter bucti]